MTVKTMPSSSFLEIFNGRLAFSDQAWAGAFVLENQWKVPITQKRIDRGVGHALLGASAKSGKFGEFGGKTDSKGNGSIQLNSCWTELALPVGRRHVGRSGFERHG